MENASRDVSEELMNVKEMAAFLKVPQNTAYKMLLARVLPSFKMGKLRRVRKSDIVNYVDSCRVEQVTGRIG
jgi:excisionase family DNA binding protein